MALFAIPSTLPGMTTTNLSTSLAEVERASSSTLVVRIRPGSILGIENIRETRDACLRLTEDGPCNVLVLFPAGLDFMQDAITVNYQTDHEAANRRVKAIALVTTGDMMARVLDVYLKYTPMVRPVGSFTSQAEAEAWLEAGAPM